MNVQLVDSLIQIILSLSADEQLAIADKLLENIPYPSTQELMQLAQSRVDSLSKNDDGNKTHP